MPEFRALAQRPVTVIVDGDEVELRPAPFEKRAENAALLKGMDKMSDAEAARRNAEFAAHCLKATVVGYDDMTIDDWVEVFAKEKAEPGLAHLVETALRLCGLGASVEQIDRLDSALGNLPTK